jgi:hypothetical protein
MYRQLILAPSLQLMHDYFPYTHLVRIRGDAQRGHRSSFYAPSTPSTRYQISQRSELVFLSFREGIRIGVAQFSFPA